VLLPGGVQDSTGTAFAQEARTSRQGADVQLPADIQPENHLEGDWTAGVRQAAATPALTSKLLTTAVSIPAQALHRNGITACHEHGVRSHRRQEDIKWSKKLLDKGVEEIWKIFIDMSW